MSHRVSVVIPVRNCEKTLKRLLDSIITQTLKPAEIVVVDDNSTDRTPSIALKYPIILLRKRKRDGPNTCRNIGAECSSGDVIVFTDGDCRPSKNWIESIVSKIKDADILVGSAMTDNLDSMISRYLDRSLISPLQKYTRETILNGDFKPFMIVTTNNIAIKREVLDKLGGFDEEYLWYGCDDMDFVYRALAQGYKVLCSKEVIIYHYNRTALRSIINRYFQYGRGFAIFVEKNGRSIYSRSIKPLMLSLVGWYILLVVLLLTSPLMMLTQIVGTYVLILSLYIKIKRFGKETIFYPILDVLLATSSVLGFFVERIKRILKREHNIY